MRRHWSRPVTPDAAGATALHHQLLALGSFNFFVDRVLPAREPKVEPSEPTRTRIPEKFARFEEVYRRDLEGTKQQREHYHDLSATMRPSDTLRQASIPINTRVSAVTKLSTFGSARQTFRQPLPSKELLLR
jgi:hypothetical protein